MSLIQAKRREYPRITNDQLKFKSFMRFGFAGEAEPLRGAYFEDLSFSGMRFVTKAPVLAKVGDSVLVEFTLPGMQFAFRERAEVVRRMNEHVIAIRFVSPARELRLAIERLIQDLHWGPLVKQLRRLEVWGEKHKQGLMISAAGALCAAVATSLIYFTSDQYNGRALRAWGKEVPAQWHWDYYKKIHKDGG